MVTFSITVFINLNYPLPLEFKSIYLSEKIFLGKLWNGCENRDEHCYLYKLWKKTKTNSIWLKPIW